MITIIWILFGILSAYLTFINYYNKTSLVDILGKKIGNPVRFFLSVVFSIAYGIFGPIGLIMLITINLDGFMINNKRSIKFIKSY